MLTHYIIQNDLQKYKNLNNMKKTIKSLLAIAIGAFAFTACSDVPEPEGYNPRQGNGLVTYVPEGTGTAMDPYNVAGVLDAMKDLAKGATTTTEICTKGYVSKIDTYSSQYKSFNYYITDNPEGKSTAFYVYSGVGLNKAGFESDTDLKVGDAVVVSGYITNYNGTIEYQKQNYLLKLNDQSAGGGGGGGDDPTPPAGGTLMTKAVEGTVVTFTSPSVTGADEVTVDLDKQGWTDKAAATTITLTNGTTIEFGAGENTTPPAYYSATHGIRVYAKNTITIKGSKKIAKVVLNCDSYSGTDYVGNEMLYANEADKNVTICNDNTEAKGGVQLRVKTMVITFEGSGEGGGGGDTPTPTAILNVDFTAGLGDWVIKDVNKPEALTYVWQQTAQYGMKASAFANSTRYATDSWLVSPSFTLTAAATMTFSQAQRYSATGCTDLHVMYSSSYTGGDIVASQWTEVAPSSWPDGTNWNYIDCTAAIPATAKYVAFRYTSTETVAGTWEIKTVKIE